MLFECLVLQKHQQQTCPAKAINPAFTVWMYIASAFRPSLRAKPGYIALCLAAFLFSSAHAQICSKWSETELIGNLDSNLLPEASGLSQSLLFPKRFYHVNDSATLFKVFVSTAEGVITDTIHLGFRLRDVEDIAVGPCPQGTCLYLGDIGDNLRQRSSLGIYRMAEQERYDNPVVLESLKLHYPDGKHDAESMAVHPDGSMYILTKEAFNLLRTSPAKLYRLDPETWLGNRSQSYVLDYVVSIDLYALSGFSFDVFSHIATSMDFSRDGKRLLILSYGDAFELDFEQLLRGELVYKKIAVNRSLQQEAISYVDADSIMFTAESLSGQSPIKRLRCLVR